MFRSFDELESKRVSSVAHKKSMIKGVQDILGKFAGKLTQFCSIKYFK